MLKKGTESQEIVPKVGNERSLRIFRPKDKISGPKKRSLLNSNHVLATTGKNCPKKKVAFSRINVSLSRNFGFFGVKMHFWPKKHFLAERKNGLFSVIPAWTGSVVILGHFLMAQTVPRSFVENGPKLRVLILMN